MDKKKMSLPNRILLINVAVIAGLVYQYFRGAPMIALVVSAVILLTLVNLIFLFQIRKAKSAL
ncbi:MAG: hypothetical protein KGN79_13270 [Acidobacteriota bacterium]|nr:hypothetical protein [Acidobacteriota bacterium]